MDWQGGDAVTVVYLDSVFVLNGVMDYFLLLATACLAGVPLRRMRFALAAVLGGLYAAAVFLPGCGALASIPGKALAGAAMALAAYGPDRKLPRLMLLLLLVSCGFAGCVLGLGMASGGVPMANGVFYTDVDVRVLLMAAGAAYVVLSVVFRASARQALNGTLTHAVLCWGDRKVELTALCDTGNGLRDPATGNPVLVACAERLRELWPPELRPFLTDRALEHPAEVLARLPSERTRFRLIPYRTVGVPSGLLLAVRTDRCVIGGRRMERLLVALSPTTLGDGFDALWGELERSEQDDHFTYPAAKGFEASGAAAGERCPLHWWQRHAAAAPVPGAGGGAGGPHRGGVGPSDADRT